MPNLARIVFARKLIRNPLPLAALALAISAGPAAAAKTGRATSAAKAIRTTSVAKSVRTTSIAKSANTSSAAKAAPTAAARKRIEADFEKAGFRLGGMASFNGESSVMVFLPKKTSPIYCRVGEVLGGYKIVTIGTTGVVFEREGVQVKLSQIESSPVAEEPTQTTEAGLDFAKFPVRQKEGKLALKTRTRAYAANKSLLQQALARAEEADAESLRSASVVSSLQYVPSSRQSLGFIAPVNGRITSNFGYRQRPTGGARKYHQGIDLQGPINCPVRASADGVVVEVSRSWAKGLNVLIRHADGYETAYFHFSRATVEVGDKVKQGQQIGNQGNSGISTGPHCHFEIHKNGQPVNPALFVKSLGAR